MQSDTFFMINFDRTQRGITPSTDTKLTDKSGDTDYKRIQGV